MSVQESINFYHTFYHAFDKKKAQELVTKLELESKQSIKSLSTGQRGRLKVALTLCRTSDVYLIDEPLNGLDPISRDMILDLLATQVDDSKCIIISSHLVHEFERICDDIVFLKDGKLEMTGDTETLRSKHNMSIHELYKEVYKYA
jgi:ABC-2 type transport system ATP-binding protein